MNVALGCLLGFLLGSLPTAFWVGKLVKGVDIRQQGSGNVGATNVFRVVGKKWGIAVMAIDMLKGFLAVWWLPDFFSSPSILSGVAAIAGHTWTPWLRFRGGKGVATSAGVFLALAPRAALASLLVWGGIFYWKRYVSLASLGTSLSFPVWVFFFYRGSEGFNLLFSVSLLVPCFIFYTHRGNIRRLQKGEEKRLI